MMTFRGRWGKGNNKVYFDKLNLEVEMLKKMSCTHDLKNSIIESWKIEKKMTNSFCIIDDKFLIENLTRIIRRKTSCCEKKTI